VAGGASSRLDLEVADGDDVAKIICSLHFVRQKESAFATPSGTLAVINVEAPTISKSPLKKQV
jgi:hypothetical protein